MTAAGGGCSLRGGSQVTKGLGPGGLKKVFRYMYPISNDLSRHPQKGLEEPLNLRVKPRKLASHHLGLVTFAPVPEVTIVEKARLGGKGILKLWRMRE